jgi:hypothetical protein
MRNAFESLGQDLRYAVRSLRKTPAVGLVGKLGLQLGRDGSRRGHGPGAGSNTLDRDFSVRRKTHRSPYLRRGGNRTGRRGVLAGLLPARPS